MNNKGELLFHEAGTRQSRLLFILSFFRWPNFKTKYYLKQIIFKWLKAPLKNPLPLKSFVFPFPRSAKLIYSKNISRVNALTTFALEIFYFANFNAFADEKIKHIKIYADIFKSS